MPPTENQPENRRGVPAEKRKDVKTPLQPDAEGLEDLDLTRPEPIDVERQARPRPDGGK